MSEFHIWGHPAHLVLEDRYGAFEVTKAFKLNTTDGTIAVDVDRVLNAINAREQEQSTEPLHRAVKFNVVA